METKIKLLLFGPTADLLGGRHFDVEMPDAKKVSDIVDQLHASHPALDSHKLLFAVNQEYVPHDTELKDGDELAIFTAVSGG